MDGTVTPPECAYDRDLYAWAMRQAALLRNGRLAVLLAHMLKWEAQPERRGLAQFANANSLSRRLTIKEQRIRLAQHLKDNPSLKAAAPEALADGYRRALVRAQRETRLPEDRFPAACPWTAEQVAGDDFLPD